MFRPSHLGFALIAAAVYASLVMAAPATLTSTRVAVSNAADQASYDAVVEAVRQTVIAAQVSGNIVALSVKAGDVVKQDQILLRIDARAASQGSLASAAQTEAARAALVLATKNLTRQKHLFDQQYISQAAMERADAQFRATSAQLTAQIAQANVATITADFFVIKAPYAGIVSELSVALGDMASPGKVLLTIYDPTNLRVSAAIPQTALRSAVAGQTLNIEWPALSAGHQWLAGTNAQILPTIDAATHTQQIRVALPQGLPGIVPGLFTRLWLTMPTTAGSHLTVPLRSIVRRAEMTGLYVIDSNQRPVLRQVRLGLSQNDRVEVLAGVNAGERIAVDPAAAVKELR